MATTTRKRGAATLNASHMRDAVGSHVAVVAALALTMSSVEPQRACAQERSSAVVASLPKFLLITGSKRATSGDVPAQAAPKDAGAYRAQRRARLMLAVGAGLLVGSTLHVAIVAPRRHCGNGHVLKKSLYTAGVLGGVGVSLALGGGAWLALSSSHAGYQRPWFAQRWFAAITGLGAALLVQPVTMVVWGLDTAGCST